MKIALIGVTGRVGTRLATELLSRGHAVTGIALHVPTEARAGVQVLQADAADPNSLAPRLVGNDAVISRLAVRDLKCGRLDHRGKDGGCQKASRCGRSRQS